MRSTLGQRWSRCRRCAACQSWPDRPSAPKGALSRDGARVLVRARRGCPSGGAGATLRDHDGRQRLERGDRVLNCRKWVLRRFLDTDLLERGHTCLWIDQAVTVRLVEKCL